MEYRAVKNRCAVNFADLKLPVSQKEALKILRKKGFKIVGVDIIRLARECIETSQYRRGARPSEAPAVVDCSSFIKWLYGMRGIWLPRRSIQQREFGETVDPKNASLGDVIFVSGRIDYYEDDPADGVGHVGICTETGTVIHAANKMDNVVESPMFRFISESNLRGIRRYVPRGSEVLTLETPPEREVETADDIKWIILQSLTEV